jgi:hypothetical protein
MARAGYQCVNSPTVEAPPTSGLIPASIFDDISDKVSAFGEKVTDRKREPQRATGTHGE